MFVESKHDERDIHRITLESGRTMPVTANPGQIVPVLVDYMLTPELKMTYNSFLGGFECLDGFYTLILFADNGQRSTLELSCTAPLVYADQPPVPYQISNNGRTITFDFCHFEDPQLITLGYGQKCLRIIVLNTATMDKTWWLDSPAGKNLLIGAVDLDLSSSGTYLIRAGCDEPVVSIRGTPAGPRRPLGKGYRTRLLRETVTRR